ncbi:hypothetical protein L3Y34_018397 [Caenorhabditis briggsae]|uniref:Phosphatidic acid phosphatase type 2/haloperoxidase domain-containing protein n=1 Tax=Caenorhabditis briggsae TaxID=6238 RepID=A0AAE9DMS9_CAEBR|nr:hypothetical protein L3Y34_018397 [Caenorhabditis briggsae]
MDVFRRSGNVVQINLLVAVANVILLYGFCGFHHGLCNKAPSYRIGNTVVPKYFVTVLTFVGYSQVGYIVNELLVKFVNGFIGRLRPYFYVVCNPLPLKECQKFDPNIYIEDYHCQGNPEEVEEARKSFYSGHSTVTMISDNKHHWSDVLVGIIVGMPLATISAFWWGKLFKTSEVDVNNCEHKCFGKKKEFV